MFIHIAIQVVVIGEVLLSAIQCVTEFNARRSDYYCFAIHLKEESSIVLGSTTMQVRYKKLPHISFFYGQFCIAI